jgi:hypothetical protein
MTTFCRQREDVKILPITVGTTRPKDLPRTTKIMYLVIKKQLLYNSYLLYKTIKLYFIFESGFYVREDNYILSSCIIFYFFL